MINERGKTSLKSLNTFGIEAACDNFIEFETADDLRTIFARGELGAWYVLGGGSNVIFTGDYRGTILHPAGHLVAVVSDDGSAVRVRAEAGVVWNDFVEFCIARELWGAENLSHIPGLAGSAPVQNIGAYGVEAKDIIESVEMFDVRSGAVLVLSRDHCGFGYRDSVFKRELRGRVVITAVNFVLGRTPRPMLDYGDLRAKVESLGGPTLRNISDAVTAIRREKLPEPEEIGNVGSFFKNPVVLQEKAAALRTAWPDMPLYPSGREGFAKLAAGWLIDRSGWKGRAHGRVGVHDRQALVLVNLGGATGAEVLALARRIQADVFEKFGVGLEMEVNVL